MVSSKRRGGLPPQVVLAFRKEGYSIAGRLGSPLEPSVLIAAHCRYDRAWSQMVPAVITVAHGELIPGGGITGFVDRLLELHAHAVGRTGQAGVVVYADVTRSPAAWQPLGAAIAEALPCKLVMGDREAVDLPFRVLGRHRLLSHMSELLSRRVLRAGLRPKVADDPNLLTDERIKAAFAAAQLKPPKVEADELMAEASPEDDIAVTAALAAWAAVEQAPDVYSRISLERIH